MVEQQKIKCVHCYVSGRVQGVFYRAKTQKKAKSLNLTGWVRNRLDGRVELVACGEDAAVDALVKWLWEGPRSARVDDIQVKQIEPFDADMFSVRSTE